MRQSESINMERAKKYTSMLEKQRELLQDVSSFVYSPLNKIIQDVKNKFYLYTSLI